RDHLVVAGHVRSRRCGRRRGAGAADEALAAPTHRRPCGRVMGRLSDQAGELAHRLGDRAEAVCRRYLSKGHREGRYWLVGDAHNTPGRSLYVRLTGSEDGRGAAGKWTDAATGDH